MTCWPKYFFFLVRGGEYIRFNTDDREEVLLAIDKDQEVSKFLIMPENEWFDSPNFWMVREGSAWFISHDEDTDDCSYSNRSVEAHPMELISTIHPNDLVSRFSWEEGECPDEG